MGIGKFKEKFSRIYLIMLVMLIIALMMSLIQVSTGYQEVIQIMDKGMEKPDGDIKYYYDGENFDSSLEKLSQTEKLVACLEGKLENENFSEEMKAKLEEINTFFKSNSLYFSFLYKDLYSGLTVSYNEESPIFTASTIKAGAMIYLYKQASLGNVDLEEKLVYTNNFYSGGSGVLKNMPVNTTYTVRELIHYAVHDSDNIAYRILMNRFGRENIKKYWEERQTNYIYTLDTIWGVTSAHDAAIYMEELYDFYRTDDVYGGKIMDEFRNAEWKMVTDKNGNFNTSNKGGWSGQAFHDVAIVWDENPYLLIIMSNAGEADYQTLFKTMSRLVGEFHELYYNQKKKLCVW